MQRLFVLYKLLVGLALPILLWLFSAVNSWTMDNFIYSSDNI